MMSRGSVSDYGMTPDEESYLGGVMESRRKMKKKRLLSSVNYGTFWDAYDLRREEVLGQGSYGKVYCAVDLFTSKEVAVKIISKSGFFSRVKVLKEVELYYLCRGVPEIVQLLEYYEDDEAFYLVFEKASGGPLFDYLQSKDSVPLEEYQARSILKDLSRALAFLHDKGIAHRDLKPENILCLNKGSPVPVKLCDFDLCSSVVPSVTTPRLTSPVGSAEYMAPEVVNAFAYSSIECDHYYQDEEYYEEISYDKRCDLWSLGVIAYILICGTMPFRGTCPEKDSCGWDAGGECSECQRTLFDAIRSGKLSFPQDKSLSREAKDLITSLLALDPNSRLEAGDVLTHPWTLGISTQNRPRKALSSAMPVPKRKPGQKGSSRRTFSNTFSSRFNGGGKEDDGMLRHDSLLFPEDDHHDNY